MKVLLAVVLGCVLLGCGGGAPPPSAPSAILDKDLPKFKRRTIAGPDVSTKESSGKVVVVKFFAKYCEPCKKTLPEAQRLHEEKPGVLFIGVAEDEHQSDVEEMISAYQLSFPVIHDRGNILAGRFRVSDLPITFVADSGGKIRWVGDGSTSETGLERAIEWVKTPHQAP